MTRGDCNRNYGFMLPACSGNGICIPETNTCRCFKGWSSLADFQTKDGVDCDIHLPTILSFACICLIVSFFGAVICLIALYSTGLNKTNGSYAKQTKIVVLLFCFLGAIIQSSLKIYDTEKNSIGSSPGSALGYFLFMWLICVGYTYFVEEIVTFLRKSCRFIGQQQNASIPLDAKLKYMKRFSGVPPSFGFLTSIFIVLAEADPSQSDKYLIGLLGALLVTLSLYFAFVLSTLPLFLEEMSKLISARPDAPDNVRVKEIHREISIAQALIKIFYFLVAPPILLFMTWNFMRRKSTYLLWLTMTSASAITSVICTSFISKSSTIRPTDCAPDSAPNLLAVQPTAEP